MLVLQRVLIIASVLASKCHATVHPVCHNIANEGKVNWAMVGFDPFMNNPTTDPDPGARGQIFEYYTLQKDGTVQISQFITKDFSHQHCTSKFESESFTNYNQYRQSKVFRYSIDVERNSVTSVSNGNEATNKEDTKIRQFFQESNGEIVVISNECVRNIVEIGDYMTPTFTHSFATALIYLNIAAKNPTSARSIDEFRRFVKAYGTHYRKKTYLGAKIVFEKRFANKSRSAAAENERQQCVRAAAYESVTESTGDIVSVENTFATKSRSCLYPETSSDGKYYLEQIGLPSEKITTLGSLPLKGSDSCETNSMVSVPIAFELGELSLLFRNLRFTITPLNQNEFQAEEFNASETSSFFESLVHEHCRIILRKNCTTPHATGCGIDSECAPSEDCVSNITSPIGYQCDAAAPVTVKRPQHLINVALNKPVTGTPAYQWPNFILTHDRVTDGDSTHTRRFFMAWQVDTPFIIVDLGQEFVIWGIRLMPRRDGSYNDKFRDISIRAGTKAVPGPDFTSYEEIVLFRSPPTITTNWMEHELDVPLRGRFVSVQNPHSITSLQITELEVLAAE